MGMDLGMIVAGRDLRGGWIEWGDLYGIYRCYEKSVGCDDC